MGAKEPRYNKKSRRISNFLATLPKQLQFNPPFSTISATCRILYNKPSMSRNLEQRPTQEAAIEDFIRHLQIMAGQGVLQQQEAKLQKLNQDFQNLMREIQLPPDLKTLPTILQTLRKRHDLTEQLNRVRSVTEALQQLLKSSSSPDYHP